MMEHGMCGMNGGTECDRERYERIWQRVAPSLSPYPPGDYSGSGASAPVPASSQNTMLSEPGAQADPCCMGSAAMEVLAVLEGFIEEELADHRHYAAFVRQAPSAARPILRQLGADEAEHARRLMAVYYLITGKCYQPHISCDRVYIGPYCPALRERYHEESCGGLNYLRAAEGTTDPCLQKLLKELSQAEYRHAEQVMGLLEKTLGNC